MVIERHILFSRLLDTEGDSNGFTNATGNYRTGQLGVTDFFTLAPEGKAVLLNRLIINYTGMNLAIDGYGSNSALVEGIQIGLVDSAGNTLIDFTAGEAIKTNNDWSKITDIVQMLTYKSLMQSMTIALDFSVFGDVIRLEKDLAFLVRLNDDFTDLTLHTFLLYGKVLNDRY